MTKRATYVVVLLQHLGQRYAIEYSPSSQKTAVHKVDKTVNIL
jgi:hypothetical protein